MSRDESTAASIDVEAERRREWWSNHGHDYYALYGDDGGVEGAAGTCRRGAKEAEPSG